MPSPSDDRDAPASDVGRPGVLLDVDGTLLDTNYLHVLAWWRAFRSCGVEGVDMATVHHAIGIASEELVQRVLGGGGLDRGPAQGGGGVDDDLVRRVSQSHSEHYEQLRGEAVPFPRTPDLLRACAERGLAVVLATSGGAGDLGWMRPAIGADDALAGVTTSEDVAAAKPAPDMLTTALEQHGLDPGRTVVVGDTVWDVDAARAAGLPCVALTCGGISRQELEHAGAAAVYATPADLLEHLDDSPLGALVGGRS